jgi:hypothetical protein
MKPSFEAVEQEIDLSKYHPQLFGTCDYVAYFSRVKTLHVVDYKHGRGVGKQPERNPQLMYYGIGALHMNKLPIEKIVLTIVQPRCFDSRGPVRSWETDPVDMLEFLATLVDDAKRTESQTAPRIPGEDQCRFCLAAATCPEASKNATEVILSGFLDETLPTAAVPLTPERLAELLSRIPQIENWCKSVNQFAHQYAGVGNAIPGFKLVDKKAHRKWAEGVTEDTIWADFRLHRDDSCTVKLKSPAQLEKIIPKEKKFLLDQYVVQNSTGKTLVADADSRPAVKGAIESMFNQE